MADKKTPDVNDLILEQQKESNIHIGTLLDRMAVMETVVMGVNKEDGIYGSLKKIEDTLGGMKTVIESISTNINNPDTGINAQIKCNKEDISVLKTFKTKVIAGILAAKTILLGIIYVVNKFNIFGSN